MTSQAHYTLELEQTASKNVQTPVSYIGGYKMLWPLASGSTGGVSALRNIGVGLLLVLYWLLVTTTFYLMIFSTLLLWVPWLIYTQGRRHRIRAARSAIATRDRQIGSGQMEGQ